MAGPRVVIARDRPDWPEVAPKRLERIALRIDPPHGAEAEASQDRDRRAPPLHGVLKQKRRYESREGQPAPVDGRAKHDPRKGERRGIGLKGPLDIPLPVEFT